MKDMKRGLLAIIAVLMTTLGMAQFAAKDSNVVGAGYIARAEIALYDSIYNNSGVDLTPMWKRTVNDLTNGWLSAVCIGELCYATTEDAGFFADVFPANSQQLVTCYFYPDQATSGMSHVEISIYDPQDSIGNHVTLVFEFNGWPLSVEEQKAEALKLYPNPATDQLFVEFNEQQPGMIQIFDLQGRMVWHSATMRPANRNIIPTRGLAAGQYVVQILDDKGQTLTAKTFTKQ